MANEITNSALHNMRESFELSAAPDMPQEGAGIASEKVLLAQMHEAIMKTINLFETVDPSLNFYKIDISIAEDISTPSKAIFSPSGKTRAMSIERQGLRDRMEEFLGTILAVNPHKGGLTLESHPSDFTYILHYDPRVMIDTLENWAREIFAEDKESLGRIFLARHLQERTHNYKPANKLN